MWDPDTWYGRAAKYSFVSDSENFRIYARVARVWTFATGFLNPTVILPDARRLTPGWGHFFLILESGGANLNVIDNALVGPVFTALTPGQKAILSLRDNTTQAGVWGFKKY